MHAPRLAASCLLAFVVEASVGTAVAQDNLARLDGVLSLADSQHRDRWGVDGWHPGYVCDGNTEGSGEGARTTSWASDNWEVTHTVALVFPQRVTVSEVTVHWGQPSDTPLTPTRFLLQGYRDGRWVELAAVSKAQPEPVTAVSFARQPVEAIRLVQPPDGASATADRRLWVAELEVTGAAAEPAVVVDTQALAAQLRAESAALREQEDAARVAPVLAVAMQRRKTRGFMAIIDRDDVERGRKNVATRPWAKNLAAGIRQDADWWLEQSDDFIYGLVPAGNPRAICPNFEKGCPIHGGARQSFTATLEAPYQWKCKAGGEEWCDGAGVKNPTTGESVTVHDDGNGWLAPAGFAEPGRRYYFVAAYRYFLIGKLFSGPYEGDGGSKYQGGTPVMQLALAYAVTGDKRYAHKCVVMLNRLAELYRTYDGCVEGPSERQDGYIGQTFERFLVQNLILACDLIWDEVEKDDELHRFFAGKGGVDHDGDGKVTGADFTYNLQRNLLGYVYEYLHRLMPYMDGDFIMYEMTALAALARCLGNADIAAEALESDLGLRVLLTNSWFRDGKFIYDSCGYNVGNAKTPLLIGEWMHGLKAPPRYAKPLDLYHHPEYRLSMLFDFLRNIDCDGRVLQIGDCGGSRDRQLRTTPPYDSNDERALLRLPEGRAFYRHRLLAASGGDLEGFRTGKADWWLLFHAEGMDEFGAGLPTAPALPKDRSAEQGALETSRLAKGARSGDLRQTSASHLFDDSGIAILRAGATPETRQHVALTFSKGAYGHGHTDKLALNLFRYGYDLTADLGYPTTWTDLKYGGWETDTASHCTVMLDESEQRSNVTGRLHYFATEPLCDVVEASCESAYPDASLYRRTVALVKDEDGDPLYTVDVFRVAGAGTRDYLFHSLGKPEELTVELADPATTWTKQLKGSLTGEDVEPMTKGGYGFLFDVQRVRTDGAFTATWHPTTGMSQPDRYLLTKRTFHDFTVEFTIVRTGKASGERERALFAFGVDPANLGNRRVAWLDAGGQLPTGKPINVRIEVAGPTASVFFDGELRGTKVDTAGAPPDDGVVGFLHYYNYAYEYRDFVLTPTGGEPIRADFVKPLDRDFWGRIDPTYQTADGSLLVSDFESVGLRLHMLGSPGREVIRAKAEGYGVRGKSPFEGHVIVRDRAADKAQGSVFVAVLEAMCGQPRVTAVQLLKVTPARGSEAPECDAVALRVTAVDAHGALRVDYIIAALDETTERGIESDLAPSRFRGRFGLVTSRAGKTNGVALVGGGHLRCGDKQLVLPGAVRGEVVEAGVATDSITVRLSPQSAKPSTTLVGRKLLVTNPAYLCPAVYTIAGVEQLRNGLWRLGVNMPLTIARGVVKSVDAGNRSFATRTPVMKLRVNPGLFDGKCVQPKGKGAVTRLRTATEDAFTLADPARLGDFATGGEYSVYDLGAGDQIEVIAQGSLP